MRSKNLILILILATISIILILLFIIFLRNPNQDTLPIREEETVYELGTDNISVDKSVFFFPVILKSVKIEGNKVISNVEAKTTNGKIFNKNIINLIEGKGNYLYLDKLKGIDKFNDFNQIEISNKEVAEKELKKYVGHYLLLTMHLSPILNMGFPENYSKYIPCNDNLYSYSTSNIALKNCEAFSPEIRVYDKNN